LTIKNQVLQLAMQIQQIPAPTFGEKERSEFIYNKFKKEDLLNVEVDQTGNVLAKLPGTNNSPPLIVSAHSDTVFPKETILKISRETGKISGPGIGDNSLGAAGLFGLIWSLRKRKTLLPGDLWLVANTCEEGLGNLRGMTAVVDRFTDEPLAYIVVEGMALGQIFHKGLGVKRYQIEAKGYGGHSWVDHGTPSAIHELASLMTKITAIELPKIPRTTLNVGVIEGGTTVNTIAAEARLQLDLRSTSKKTLRELAQQVEHLVNASSKHNLKLQAKVIGERPAGSIPANHPLVKLAVRIMKEKGIKSELNIGSTDANIPLSRGYPSICIGLTSGSGAHTINEYINTDPIEVGLMQFVDIVEQSYDALK
jgi:tripeptide aminopeptidase